MRKIIIILSIATIMAASIVSIGSTQESKNALVKEYKFMYQMMIVKNKMNEVMIYSSINSFYAEKCNKTLPYKTVANLPYFNELLIAHRAILKSGFKEYKKLFLKNINTLKCK